MKVAIGIPFLATGHDAALRLCLLSLERHAGVDCDVFLQVDNRNWGLAKDFNLDRLVRRHPRMRVKRYRSGTPGACKQDLVEWVTSREGYDAAVFLHADLFLYRDGLLPGMLQKMRGGGCLACFWTVPLLASGNPLASREISRRPKLLAPRISTWLFCLDCAAYRRLARRFAFGAGLFSGHHVYPLSRQEHPLVAWVRRQPEFPELGRDYRTVFCDNGAYFRYAMDTLRLPGHSMGTMGHPCFESRKLARHPDGFVHVEQFRPDRFRVDYSAELFAERERLVLAELSDNYGETD